MGKINKISYELRDIAVLQSPISYQEHRGDVNPYTVTCGRKTLPIFVAPMAAVTDEKNYKIWIENKITPVIPRSVQNNLSIEERLKISQETFVSFSLSETKDMYVNGIIAQHVDKLKPLHICIDIAHGTLKSLYDICREIKHAFRESVVLMTGNIANPKAYEEYCRCGIDFCRFSVGSGSRCTSSCNVAVHIGLATLLDDVQEVKANMYRPRLDENPIFTETKIIADGGIGWFDDIQKALVLGADYVMIGKMFAECEEACGPTSEMFVNGKCVPCRDYYGMSTKRAQKITGGDGNKTSEGISRPVEIKYPVKKLLDNVESYLRSCMTYTNSNTLSDLKKAEVVILGGSGDSSYRK